MRAVRTSLCAGVLMTLCPGIGSSQATIPQEATDDEAVVLEASNLESALADLRSGRLSSGRILEGGDVFSVTMLHRTAPTATIHGSLSDLYVIQEGSATLVTGGSLVDPEPASRPGDTRAVRYAGVPNGSSELGTSYSSRREWSTGLETWGTPSPSHT